MAMIFFDSCGDYYDSDTGNQVWTRWSASPSVLTTGGRRSSAGIELGQNDEVSCVFDPGVSNIFVGFAFKVPSLTFLNELLWLREGDTTHINFETDTGGVLRCERNGTFLGASPAGTIFENTWHYLECHVIVADGTGGSVEVRIDGATVINLSSIDTRNGGNGVIDTVLFDFATGGVQATIDDFYILDTTGTAPQNTFLGDVHVNAVLPDGDGFSSAFDTTFPSSPTTHYTKVDESPHTGDTDYNETPTVNDVDLFDYAALPTITGGSTVISVKAAAASKKPDGSLAQMRLVTRPTSTTFNGAKTNTLQSDYKYKFEIWDDDPQASAAWTDSTINAAEFGVESL
ncbi:MAG: hypothetical protein ACYSUC_02210 [Planctomycetota bacterium]|jgi:hypothetical protein